MPISSTQAIPIASQTPEHVAIIMDGNGRWAQQRHLPRTAGHIRGLSAVRKIVRFCGEFNIKYLTLFSFSSENWRRPNDEVNLLMRLFSRALTREVDQLVRNGIRLRIIGDISAFDESIQAKIAAAQELTAQGERLHLTIAANYGGRWDILQAIQKFYQARVQGSAQSLEQLCTEEQFAPYLSMAWAPEPDLFIRTGGEQRISNFLIWQLAYTELYFTSTYWPDFNKRCFEQAIASYGQRERRFGRISEQLKAPN
ncbi:polyprenyl diphosphate synthase [Brackiella oedipodis]|uniref:polyprenyl diphosphate synthase n=1 Tax=Brackiella oedipodis TaxID=124225 RepID=UPI00048FD749|nr:polyprenyl diphosphate synthase [Brackiella oedipodis]